MISTNHDIWDMGISLMWNYFNFDYKWVVQNSYLPEGMLGSDCVVGVTSGVSSEESAGELSGEIAEAVGPLAAARPQKRTELTYT